MKLRILVKIVEKLLGITVSDGEPRADMFLPERGLAIGVVLLAGGISVSRVSISGPPVNCSG